MEIIMIIENDGEKKYLKIYDEEIAILDFLLDTHPFFLNPKNLHYYMRGNSKTIVDKAKGFLNDLKKVYFE